MSSGTPPAATVVIVMCIAALVVIVVLGIYRIHTTHQDGSKEDEEGRKDPEMDWDDSNLNITVNPMEVSMRLIAKEKCRGSNFNYRFYHEDVLNIIHMILLLVPEH